MKIECVFILSVSSDIGQALALEYLNDGCEVIGTYRNRESVVDLEKRPGMQLLYCDIASVESIRSMIIDYGSLSKPWGVFISSVGTLEPIGPFFSQDFDSWEQSVTVNSIAQLRVLRELYAFRQRGRISHAVFFAGGGINNPFTNYSAYTASKVFLVKMCELLDDENQDLNVFIVGPGFRPTKIHNQTINNPYGAGDNLERTFGFLRSERPQTSFRDIYHCINWCIAQGKSVAGGRNFSVVRDHWLEDAQLVEQLQRDRNKFKLRRFRNEER